MHALARAFFERNPGLSLGALVMRDNASGLDLSPLGVPAVLYEPSAHKDLVEQYLRLNHHAFRALPLPRWVLSDLYLLPGVIGLILGPASLMDEDARAAARVQDGQQAILAAYVGAPSLVPGRYTGVSLIGFSRGLGAGTWAKLLTLKMVRATHLRGVTQWDNKSLRVHTRLGPLKVLGPAPGGHELGGHSFVYECDLTDDAQVAKALTRSLSPTPARAVSPEDAVALQRILQEAQRGVPHVILPPGLDEEGRVLFAQDQASPHAAA